MRHKILFILVGFCVFLQAGSVYAHKEKERILFYDGDLKWTPRMIKQSAHGFELGDLEDRRKLYDIYNKQYQQAETRLNEIVNTLSNKGWQLENSFWDNSIDYLSDEIKRLPKNRRMPQSIGGWKDNSDKPIDEDIMLLLEYWKHVSRQIQQLNSIADLKVIPKDERARLIKRLCKDDWLEPPVYFRDIMPPVKKGEKKDDTQAQSMPTTPSLPTTPFDDPGKRKKGHKKGILGQLSKLDDALKADSAEQKPKDMLEEHLKEIQKHEKQRQKYLFECDALKRELKQENSVLKECEKELQELENLTDRDKFSLPSDKELIAQENNRLVQEWKKKSQDVIGQERAQQLAEELNQKLIQLVEDPEILSQLKEKAINEMKGSEIYKDALESKNVERGYIEEDIAILEDRIDNYEKEISGLDTKLNQLYQKDWGFK